MCSCDHVMRTKYFPLHRRLGEKKEGRGTGTLVVWIYALLVTSGYSHLFHLVSRGQTRSILWGADGDLQA